jgi:hypothetical protein
MMEIFQPQLELVREPDGEYSLHAVTITPNSGYSAGRARIGTPPNVRLIGEALGVILDLRVRRGAALQVLTPVRHHLRNLKLGPKQGKTSVTAFAVLRGDIVGTASIDVRAVQECPKKNPVTVDTTDWYAYLDKMPPGPPSLHVSGVVYLPTPGYDAVLVPASPQGINPKELILDLVVTPRPGLWPQVITAASVRHDDRTPGIAYEGILIREPDGDGVHIDVEDVH